MVELLGGESRSLVRRGASLLSVRLVCHHWSRARGPVISFAFMSAYPYPDPPHIEYSKNSLRHQLLVLRQWRPELSHIALPVACLARARRLLSKTAWKYHLRMELFMSGSLKE